jgi:peptide/nickel transport system substrate-binding protein
VLEDAPRTLDPHHHNEVVAWSLLCNFYDGLVRFDPEMRLEPALAAAWERTDATHLRFTLRSGVVFHDGQPFSSADVVASFRRARDDPASRIRHLLVGIRSVAAVDARTVVVETDGPVPTLLNRLALLFIVPRGAEGQAEITRPVGTGPYRFRARREDGSVEAEAFRGWRGTPPVESVRFSFASDDEARARRLLDGRADVVVRLSFEDVSTIARQPGLRVEPQPRLSVQLLEANPDHASGRARSALASPAVRRAVLLGINRSRLVDQVMHGNGTVATQYVHPLVFGFDPTLSATPYDPEEARRQLVAAGFPSGFDVVLGAGPTSASQAVAIAEDLERLGLRVRVELLSLTELVDRSRSPQVTLRYYGRTCITGDASELLDAVFHSPDPEHGFGGENYTGYADPETDALLEAANHEMDAARRLELLRRAQRRILDDLPALPILLSWSYVGLSDRVEPVLRHDQWLWVGAFRWR